jgi:hypothetical protein
MAHEHPSVTIRRLATGAVVVDARGLFGGGFQAAAGASANPDVWIGVALGAIARYTTREFGPPMVLGEPDLIARLREAGYAPAEERARERAYQMPDGTVVVVANAAHSWPGAPEPGSFRETLHKSRKGRYYLELQSLPPLAGAHAEWVSPEEAARWLLAHGMELPADLRATGEALSE